MRYQPQGTPWASCERVRGDNINIGSIAAHRRRPSVCRQSSPPAPSAKAVLEEDVEQSAPARSSQNLSASGGAIKNSNYHRKPHSRYVKTIKVYNFFFNNTPRRVAICPKDTVIWLQKLRIVLTMLLMVYLEHTPSLLDGPSVGSVNPTIAFLNALHGMQGLLPFRAPIQSQWTTLGPRSAAKVISR